MTVATGTKTQFEAAYTAVHKLAIALKLVQQGQFVAGKIPAGIQTSLQTLVDAAETALEPLGNDAS